MTNVRTLPGTPLSAFQAVPFIGAAPISMDGVYLGTQLGVRSSLCINDAEAKEAGLTHTTSRLITGQVGCGKTQLKQDICIRSLGIQAGSVDGMPQFMTQRTHDRKVNPVTGKGENEKWVTRFYGKTTNLATERSINPYGLGDKSDLWQLVDTTLTLAKHAMDRPITEIEAFAAQIGVWLMSKFDPKSYDLDLAATLHLNMNEEDIRLYFEDQSNNLLATYTKRFADDPELFDMLKPVTERKPLLRTDEILAAAFRIYTALVRIQGADYGNVFGGNSKLDDLLGGRLHNWNWLGLTGRAISLINILEYQWLEYCQLHQLTHLIAKINANDEGHEAYLSEDFIIRKARTGAKSRSLAQIDYEVTQYIRQLLKVSGLNSHVRAAAASIQQTIGARILGRIEPNDKEGIEECFEMGYSDAHLRLQQALPRGYFSIKLPTRRDPIFFRHEPTKLELELGYSEGAVASMTNYVPLDENDDPRYAEMFEDAAFAAHFTAQKVK